MGVDQFLTRCKQLSVLVIGDLMVDRYLWGKVSRISPEAPVPIVNVTDEENRLGGAANVALNVHALGAKPILCGLVGADRDGVILRSLTQGMGFSTECLVPSEHRRTTVKVRVIGNQQQVLRVDKEDIFPANQEEIQSLLSVLQAQIPLVDLIIIEDYDKGLLSPALIQQIVERAKEHQVPINVDPKFNQFWAYSGVTLFKPNLKELNEGLKIHLDKKNIEGICQAVLALRENMPHENSLITLSEQGVLWVDKQGESEHIPAHYRDIVDVSGAGDTVISVASLALAAGISPHDAIQLANLAGGLVCEEVGVVPINPKRLMEEFNAL